MSEQWTPERIAWWCEHLEDTDRVSQKRAILSLLGTIQSQRAELEAAREVVEAARSAKEKHGFGCIEEAVSAYDALRSQRATSGCYDPWGLERSE